MRKYESSEPKEHDPKEETDQLEQAWSQIRHGLHHDHWLSPDKNGFNDVNDIQSRIRTLDERMTAMKNNLEEFDGENMTENFELSESLKNTRQEGWTQNTNEGDPEGNQKPLERSSQSKGYAARRERRSRSNNKSSNEIMSPFQLAPRINPEPTLTLGPESPQERAPHLENRQGIYREFNGVLSTQSKMDRNQREPDTELILKEQREKAIEELQARVFLLERENGVISNENRRLRETMVPPAELESILRENEIYKKRINEIEEQFQEAFLSRTTENQKILEINALKSSIKRLIELLHLTSEYKGIKEMEEDAPGGIRYLSELAKNKQGNPPKKGTCGRKCCSETANGIKNEKFEWVPKDAFEFATHFVLDVHMGKLGLPEVHELLFHLNKTWTLREESKIKKTKEQMGKELKNYKRTTLTTNSGEVMALKGKVERQQLQIKELKSLEKVNFNSSVVQETLRKLQIEKEALLKELEVVKRKKADLENEVMWLRENQMQSILISLKASQYDWGSKKQAKKS